MSGLNYNHVAEEHQGLPLNAWFAEYSKLEHQREISVREQVPRTGHEQHDLDEQVREHAIAQLARASWGRCVLAIHEKWWPVDLALNRYPLRERKGIPFFTAADAWGYQDEGRPVAFVMIELVALSIPLPRQLGDGGISRRHS